MRALQQWINPGRFKEGDANEDDSSLPFQRHVRRRVRQLASDVAVQLQKPLQGDVGWERLDSGVRDVMLCPTFWTLDLVAAKKSAKIK
jgi:hypothetical protein